MYRRSLYLDKILPFVDKPLIKVISGIRRSGKSSILILIKQILIERGVNEKQIIFLNFESFDNQLLTKDEILYAFIKSKIQSKEKYYLFLDEIQEVYNWEKVLNSCLLDFNIDIYITGSNSKLLSSELSTYIAGRYIEFQIQTLNFKESLSFNKNDGNELISKQEKFKYFLEMGGFPIIHLGNYSQENAYKLVQDIYSSVVLRDAIQRYAIRDLELFERVIRYVFDGIGTSFSAKNIADYFKSQQRKIDLNTVYNYLNALEGAFIIYKIPRFDIQGKEILKTQEKYYVSDLSLVYSKEGYKEQKINAYLENIVLLELKSRDYKVFVGKYKEYEIDFIATKNNQKIYIQVCYRMIEQSTIDREFFSLKKVADNYPKYVLSMDESWKDTIEGIKHLNIIDFLLLESF